MANRSLEEAGPSMLEPFEQRSGRKKRKILRMSSDKSKSRFVKHGCDPFEDDGIDVAESLMSDPFQRHREDVFEEYSRSVGVSPHKSKRSRAKQVRCNLL